MPPFLRLHALAAQRGDGLHPELLALFESLATAPKPDPTGVERDHRRADCVVQFGPNPVPAEVAVIPDNGRVRPLRAQATGHPHVLRVILRDPV